MGTQPSVQTSLQNKIFVTGAQKAPKNRYQISFRYCLNLLDFLIFSKVFCKGLLVFVSENKIL